MAVVAPAFDATVGFVGDLLLIFTRVVGRTCSEVVRLLLERMFDIPSEYDCVGDGVDDSMGLLAYRSCLSADVDGVAGALTGFSESAVVAAAFDVDPAPTGPLGKGASLPPLKDKRDDELAREPGRKGEGRGGECARLCTRLGEGGGGPLTCGEGDGVLLRECPGGVAGMVSS